MLVLHQGDSGQLSSDIFPCIRYNDQGLVHYGFGSFMLDQSSHGAGQFLGEQFQIAFS